MNELGPLQIIGVLFLASGALIGAWYVGRRLLRKWPPMMPLAVQSMFMYCALFTIGIILISTQAYALLPLGIVLSFVGLAIFLPEPLAARLLGVFFLLLSFSLLAVLNQLLDEQPLFKPQKLSVWFAGAFALVWGMGILFAWRRWLSGRVKGKDEV